MCYNKKRYSQMSHSHDNSLVYFSSKNTIDFFLLFYIAHYSFNVRPQIKLLLSLIMKRNQRKWTINGLFIIFFHLYWEPCEIIRTHSFREINIFYGGMLARGIMTVSKGKWTQRALNKCNNDQEVWMKSNDVSAYKGLLKVLLWT